MDLFSSFTGGARRDGGPRPDAPAVLIVDDNRTNLQLMGKRLTRMGYTVSLSDNGVEALDLMQARYFDLVLMDMTMPGLSGTATLRELRVTPGIGDTPVLMITGRSDDGAVIEALKAGADDHVAKPFAFEVLGARIERLLERRRAVEELKRSNAMLDARIAHRAIELGEIRNELAETRADRLRLASSVRALEDEVRRLAGTSA